MQIGTDEAGKGPVLGSMFAAGVRADPATLPEAVADSKQLSRERRDELDAAIRAVADVAVVEVSVDRIDAPETDMNSLTVAAHADALSELVTGTETVYLDAADTNAVRFERRVADRLQDAPELRAEHAADEQYPVVSAASIVAKVARDVHANELAATYGEVGSGYPGDETTREFLREFVTEHEQLPACARVSWQTSRDIRNELGQVSLSEFEREQSSLSEF